MKTLLYISILGLLSCNNRTHQSGKKQTIDSTAKVESTQKNDNSKFYTRLDCRNGQQSMERAESNQYDMILADLHMPQTNALQMIQRLRELQPSAKILIFAMSDESVAAPKYFQLGVDGYLCKDCEVEMIPLVITKMMASRKDISLPLMDQMLNTRSSRSFRNPFHVLTTTEKRVASWLVKSEDTQYLQAELRMEAETIDVLTINILEKMKLVTTLELKLSAELYL